MSWVDQGRQQHGWFGHGTAPHATPEDLRARAFAIVHFAADAFPNHDDLPFSLEKTTIVLRTLAPQMAPYAYLQPNAFRLRFFHDSFDPVDAWSIQEIMRDVDGSNDHASLVQSGKALGATIERLGKNQWALLLGATVAKLAPEEFQGQRKSYRVPQQSSPHGLASGVVPRASWSDVASERDGEGLRTSMSASTSNTSVQASKADRCRAKCADLAFPTKDYGIAFQRCYATCMGIWAWPEWQEFFDR